MRTESIEGVFGVDFSGAREAGVNTWIAEIDVSGAEKRLLSLESLETLAGTASRAQALAWLVESIKRSRQALWGIDAPFGLPIELGADGGDWTDQLRRVEAWTDDAPAFGRSLAQSCLKRLGVLHVRRETDILQRTPFDSYHYRIIHQTFHVMRDVLAPLARAERVAVLPFQYERAERAQAIVVEACPSSTLLRLELPRRGYKQPTGGPLRADRRVVRREILEEVTRHITVSPKHLRMMEQNPGGDAMDAVLAGVGSYERFMSTDHAAMARHARAVREGWVFA